MEKVFVGKTVSTHGIKGEIKILSEFEYKDNVFKVGNELIIDDVRYVIKSYRHHKNFEMVTLNDYKDINEILFLMKKKVFVDKESLSLGSSQVLDSELVNYKVRTIDGQEGSITEVFFASPSNKILRVSLDKEYLIPVNSPMIKEINKEKCEVVVELISGM